MSNKIDGSDEKIFSDWSKGFIQIILQVHELELGKDLPSQLTGIKTKKDFNLRKITTGVSAIKKTYDEAPLFLKELKKLKSKYPNIYRELNIEFLTLMLRTDEIHKFIHTISDGGKFTLNGKKALHGWIKKEFENIFNWVKDSKTRKQLLFNFLTKNEEYSSLRDTCYRAETLNLPNPPKSINEFSDWLRKERSRSKREINKILIKN